MSAIARSMALAKLQLGRIGLAAVVLAAITVAAPLSAQERQQTPAPEMMQQMMQEMLTQMMRQIMQEMMPGATATAEGAMMSAGAPVIPAVTGYSEGRTILFIHTAASDPGIADLLTDMMGSIVLTVPSLAEMPADAVGSVFVFTNGLKPDGPAGPLGFQPDVFDNPPGSPDYTPLRAIVLVSWAEGAAHRVLKSSAAVLKAIEAGEASLERPGIVVNMPMLTWPVGRR